MPTFPRLLLLPFALIALAAPQTASAATASADLVTASVSNPPQNVTRGATFSFSDTVRNQGTAPAAATTTRVYLSIDTAVGNADLAIGGRSVGALAAGASSRAQSQLQVAATTPAGAYYVISCADAGRAVRESSESNNCRASTGRVNVKLTVPQPPALVSTAPTSPGTSTTPAVNGTAEPGSTVRIFAATCAGTAIGTATASPSGAFAITVAVAADAATNLVAAATNAAGSSTCSSAIAYTHVTPPPAPAIWFVNGSRSDTGITVWVGGDAAPATTLTLYAATGTGNSCSTAQVVGMGVVPDHGSWSMQTTAADGVYTEFFATVTAGSGVTSACSAAATYDAVAPAPVVVLGTDPASGSPDTYLHVTGTADEPGALVILWLDDKCTVHAGGSGTVLADGTWSAAVNVTAGATMTFWATAQDGNGNRSACSSTSATYTSTAEPSTDPATGSGESGGGTDGGEPEPEPIPGPEPAPMAPAPPA